MADILLLNLDNLSLIRTPGLKLSIHSALPREFQNSVWIKLTRLIEILEGVESHHAGQLVQFRIVFLKEVEQHKDRKELSLIRDPDIWTIIENTTDRTIRLECLNKILQGVEVHHPGRNVSAKISFE